MCTYEGVSNMKEIIADFLQQEKKQMGIEKPEVSKAEIAMVQCAFLAVKDHYPEKNHVQLIRICCDTMMEAEKKQLNGKIGLMISRFNEDIPTVPFTEINSTFHK